MAMHDLRLLLLPIIMNNHIIMHAGSVQAVQQVILDSSVTNGSRICAGQPVWIKCKTVGSSIQVWSSKEYMGSNPGPLSEIIYNVNTSGTVSNLKNGASLELLNSTQSDSEGIRLVSIFRLEASTTFPNPTVTCSLNTISKSITFTVIGKK